MKRLWLTGADGFVGQHVARAIAAAPSQAISLVSAASPLELRDGASVDRVVEHVLRDGADWVLHLAAMSFVPDSIRDPETCFDVNLMGTVRLLNALVRHGFKGRFLYVSSADVYGATNESAMPLTEASPTLPRNPYAASKLAAEAASLQQYRAGLIDVVVARPFNHIGTGQRADFVVPSVARQLALIARGEQPATIRLGDTSVTRDFSDVRDIVAAYLALLQSGRSGDIYNVCSGQERRVADVVARLVALSGCNAVIESDSARLRPGEQRRAVGACDRLRRDTAWSIRCEWDDTLNTILEDWKQRLT
ncbi:MAG: GDP-mannose 4,6-dehydratase [Burkholderiales bacterium]|nr:GDP-mannose 4,6-dehydratase [Burkholderiales bacterium]